MLVNPTNIGNALVIESRTVGTTINVPQIIQNIQTNAYDFRGDGGGGVYARVSSLPAHPGYFQSADGSYFELTDREPNLEQFGAKANGTDDILAFERLFAYMSAKGYSSCQFKGRSYTLLNPPSATIVIPTGTSVEGNGAFIFKRFNGDMFDVRGRCNLRDIQAEGGGTYTGRPFICTAGNDQLFDNLDVTNFGPDYCLEYVGSGVGSRSEVRGGRWARTNIVNPAIKFPVEGLVSSDRRLNNVNANGGCLVDLGDCDNAGIFNCDVTNIIFNAGTKKVRMIGNRVAGNGANTKITYNGSSHTIIGNIHAVDIDFASGLGYSCFSNNTTATNCVLQDLGGSPSNLLDIVLTPTPVFTADTVNPTIGNGSITSRLVRKGALALWSIELTWGSTSTTGTGAFNFRLPAPLDFYSVFSGRLGICRGTVNSAPFTGTVYCVGGFSGQAQAPQFKVTKNSGGDLAGTGLIAGDKIYLEIQWEVGPTSMPVT